MSVRSIFEHTRPAGFPLDGAHVTVRASVSERTDDGAGPYVTIVWERDDFEAEGIEPVQMTLTVGEFQGIATGIVDALDQPDAARRTHAPTDAEQAMAPAAHLAATNPQHFDHDPYSREGFDANGDPVYPKG